MMQRLVPRKTAVVVIDVQERLSQAMPEAALEEVLRATSVLVSTARLLGAPVLLTEQYPKGIGPTLPPVREAVAAAGGRTFEKLEFSAWDAAGFPEALRATSATDVVIVGMEAHVCVFQTVRDLVAAGLSVHVPIDGVASRRADHREAGLSLCVAAGAVRTTAESVVFDWLRRAGTEEFRAVSKLVK